MKPLEPHISNPSPYPSPTPHAPILKPDSSPASSQPAPSANGTRQSSVQQDERDRRMGVSTSAPLTQTEKNEQDRKASEQTTNRAVGAPQPSANKPIADLAGGVPVPAPSPTGAATSSTPPQQPDPTHSASHTSNKGYTIPNRATYELIVDGAATGKGFQLQSEAEAEAEKLRAMSPDRRVEIRDTLAGTTVAQGGHLKA